MACLRRSLRCRPQRLLALVFAVAAVTTAVLSLDATVVLLTPVVFATAARLAARARPHLFDQQPARRADPAAAGRTGRACGRPRRPARVNIGPNLTYTGSLATLLWRRVLRQHGSGPSLWEFTRLGLLTVPAGLAIAVLALWAALHVLGG